MDVPRMFSRGGGVQNAKWTRKSAIADKPRDAFRGQSGSPNNVMVPFYMSRMVSYYCAIVILSLSVRKFDFKNVVTLKTGLKVREGH